MITFAYAYYDNPNMLVRQIEEWLSYPRSALDKIKFIVVDDGSQKAPAHPVVQQAMQSQWGKLDLALYQVLENKPWNQDGARNLAMKNVTTEWAFLCDMDHMLQAKEVSNLFKLPMRAMTAYMPNQIMTDGVSLKRPHPNTYIMRVEDFWHVGGYDEDFSGVYGSDYHFQRMMREWGVRLDYTTLINLVVYRTEDIEDANTKDWGRKGTDYTLSKHAHLIAKTRGPKYKPVDPIRFRWRRIF